MVNGTNARAAKNVGTNIINDIAKSVDFKVSLLKLLVSFVLNILLTSDYINRAQARWLGLDSEKKFQGYGVSACATCDGFFFKEKKVAVIGGGNSAVEEALYLTNFASKVYLVHRRNELRAEKILQDRLFKNEKVECVWDSELEEIVGDEDPLNVKSINIKNTKTNETSNIELDGDFVAIGHDPATQIFKDQVEMDEDGYNYKPDSTLQTLKVYMQQEM